MPPGGGATGSRRTWSNEPALGCCSVTMPTCWRSVRRSLSTTEAAALTGARPRWTNWGSTYSCSPTGIDYPATEEEIAGIVQAAATSGERVKVAGTGHSFTDIACTEGRLIKLERYAQVLDVDMPRATVTAQAGITIARLSEELAHHGLAMENIGDVAYQTIGGAISTATHGTGERLRNMSSQVCALSLVLAGGTVLHCSPTTEAEIFGAARVGLGALGVVSTVTLQCVPLFNLRSVEEPRRLDDVLESFDELAAANDHFEFFWFPHTDWVQAITNNRTSEPARPKSRMRSYIEDILF